MQENAVSLLRVSSKRQQDEGEGIPLQRKGNNEYIKRKGYFLFKEFELAETAANKTRIAFQDVLDFCVKHKTEIQVVVIHRVDRFSRGGLNTYYAFKAILAGEGIRLESATENIDNSPSGEALEGILAVIARYDNRNRIRNTISAEQKLTQEGFWCRPAPTGFVNSKKIVGYKDGKPVKKPILIPENEKQWNLLCYGLRKQLSGSRISEVVYELTKKGFLMRETKKKDERKRNPPSSQSWGKMCRNSLYGGMINEKWTDYKDVPAQFECPLTPEEWHGLQKQLKKNGSKSPLRQRRCKLNSDVPLRRFLRCPACKNPARGNASIGKMGKKYLYYDCPNSRCKFRMSVAQVHKQFTKYLLKVRPSTDLLVLFKEVFIREWENKYLELNRESIELAEKVTNLKKEKRDLIDLMKASKDDPVLLADLQKAYKKTSLDLAVYTIDRNEKEKEEYDAETVFAYCRYYLEHASELWQKSDVHNRNRLQSLIFPEGIDHDSLTNKTTPKFSLVYEAIKRLESVDEPLAAPRRIELLFPG